MSDQNFSISASPLPRLSVYMPLLNAGPYLETAIESIRAQSMSDWRLFIVDGGSQDGSVETVRRLAEHDERIVLIERPDTHPTRRANELLPQLQSEFVAVMHGDDISLAQRFEKQVEFLESHPDVGLCGSWVGYLYDGDPVPTPGQTQWKPRLIGQYPVTHEEIWCCLPFWWCFCLSSVMWRNDFFRQGGRVDESLQFSADQWLWFEMMKQARAVNIPEVLHLYRSHDASESGRFRSAIWEEGNLVCRKIMAALPIGASPAQLDLHAKLRLEPDQVAPIYTASDLRAVERWLWFLWKRNISLQIFNGSALRTMLARYWWVSCRIAARQGVPATLLRLVCSPLFWLRPLLVPLRVLNTLRTHFLQR